MQFWKKDRKSTNAIQALTFISVLATTIIAIVSILVLSVFNGLTFLLGDLNAVFYPDLKIQPKQGKVFTISEENWAKIQEIDNVEAVSKVIEEVALFENNSKQVMGVVKGVDENYADVSAIEKGIFRGMFKLQDEKRNYAVLGLGVVNEIGLNTSSPFSQVSIFIPQRKKRVAFGPASLFGRVSLKPAGEFAIQKEFDDKYVFVPIETLRPILNYPKEVSYVEVKLSNEKRSKGTQKALQKLLGNDIEVLNRQQQNESWYKVMRFEKWMSFAILLLVMFIASFNLLSSLTMMVLDKTKDIRILRSMGMSANQLMQVFRWQGLLIGIVGSLVGATIAILIVLAQKKFGIVPLQGSFVVDSYPIELNGVDIALTILALVVISWLASLLPSRRVKKIAEE